MCVELTYPHEPSPILVMITEIEQSQLLPAGAVYVPAPRGHRYVHRQVEGKGAHVGIGKQGRVCPQASR